VSFDPQDAPLNWVDEIRRLIDIDGVRVVLVRDQDGVEFLIDEDLWEGMA
jgi:hypothetical protein